MDPIPLRHLYDRNYDRNTGKLKFKHRLRLFAERHAPHIFIACCLILFTVILFGSVMLGFVYEAPFIASFVMMAAMFFGALHIKQSMEGRPRYHQYPYPKPPDAHFENKSNLDKYPEQVDARLEAMKKPKDAPDIPEGT